MAGTRWSAVRRQRFGAAASFSVTGGNRGAVTLSIRVANGFWEQIEGGAAATLLLSPNEARGFAAWLDEAAQAADQIGPPLYDG